MVWFVVVARATKVIYIRICLPVIMGKKAGKKKMGPALKAFLKKYKRFPRKGELRVKKIRRVVKVKRKKVRHMGKKKGYRSIVSTGEKALYKVKGVAGLYVIGNAAVESRIIEHGEMALKHIMDLDGKALQDRVGYFVGDVKAKAKEIATPAVILLVGKKALNYLGIKLPAWVAGK